MAASAASADMSAPAPAAASAASAPSLAWIRSLPKVEMHAHLSGSVRDATIRAMLDEERVSQGDHSSSAAGSYASTFISGERTLSQCFEVFALLHRLLSSLEAVARVTREVISDFAADEVVYLELRTTPRALPAKGTSKRDYVQTVTDTIRECERSMRTPRGERIRVRLLLSIDRSGTQADAESTVDLAAEFAAHAEPIVVGIDFSGNPMVSSFREFEHHFQRARTLGLKSSVHVGEKSGDSDDLDAVLDRFRPERIGHVVCLDPRHTALLLERPIPIEICPTSNLKTRIVQQLEQHPFGTWQSRNNRADSAQKPYPLVVCTDDSGVFNITLSSELHKLAEAFHMDSTELLQLETSALEHAFADEKIKAELRAVFERFRVASSDTRPIGILTSLGDDEFKGSDRALFAAFAARGIAAEHVVWNDPSISEWTKYRGIVIRSIWDYHESLGNVRSLFEVLGKMEFQGVTVLNPPATVRWNHCKSYLRELAQLGIPTVETEWVENLVLEQSQLEQRIRARGWTDCVIKPQISAGGTHTYRFTLDPSSVSSKLPSFSECLEKCPGQDVPKWLIQPFMQEVLDEGEWSFIFINGEYSHCVLCTPAGVRGEPTPAFRDEHAPARSADVAREAAASPTSFMVQQVHGGSFRYQQPSSELIAQARAALHATPFGRDTLYARVDCLRRGSTLLVSELELLEPELFGRGVEGFNDRFIDAIELRLARAQNEKAVAADASRSPSDLQLQPAR